MNAKPGRKRRNGQKFQNFPVIFPVIRELAYRNRAINVSTGAITALPGCGGQVRRSHPPRRRGNNRRFENIMTKYLLPAFVFICIVFSATVPVRTQAVAQKWSTRSVKLYVPFGPGSTPDMVARLIADRLAHKLGQPFVVEDKRCRRS